MDTVHRGSRREPVVAASCTANRVNFANDETARHVAKVKGWIDGHADPTGCGAGGDRTGRGTEHPLEQRIRRVSCDVVSVGGMDIVTSMRG